MIRAATFLAGPGLWLAALLIGLPPVQAQQRQNPVPQATEPTNAIPQGPQSITLPSAIRLNLLIRSSLMALNHANRSGNYSVLRDLGAPAFQKLNTPASLAEKFAGLRKAEVDLTPVFYFHPKLKKQPALENGRFLRLVGFIPTKPKQIDFDLAYQNIDGQWQLVAISVGVSDARPNIAKRPADVSPPAAAAAPPAVKPAKSAAADAEKKAPDKMIIRVAPPTKSPERK